MVAKTMSISSNLVQPKNNKLLLSLPVSKAKIFQEKHGDLIQQECSMCGDVGFSSELFRCKKCDHRFQHAYCSRFYPSIPDQDVCDWCLLQDANLSSGSSSNKSRTVSNLAVKKRQTDIPSPKSCSNKNNSNSDHKDALELLLEVAQHVAHTGIDKSRKHTQDHGDNKKIKQENIRIEEINKKHSDLGVLKPRKVKLQLTTSRSMGRRYKLLSDVLC